MMLWIGRWVTLEAGPLSLLGFKASFLWWGRKSLGNLQFSWISEAFSGTCRMWFWNFWMLRSWRLLRTGTVFVVHNVVPLFCTSVSSSGLASYSIFCLLRRAFLIVLRWPYISCVLCVRATWIPLLWYTNLTTLRPMLKPFFTSSMLNGKSSRELAVKESCPLPSLPSV